jgi:hypothetical protein
LEYPGRLVVLVINYTAFVVEYLTWQALRVSDSISRCNWPPFLNNLMNWEPRMQECSVTSVGLPTQVFQERRLQDKRTGYLVSAKIRKKVKRMHRIPSR